MKNTLLFLTACVLISCGGADHHASELSSRLDSLFSAQTTSENPGVAALVAFSDTVVYSSGYGIADVRSSEKITTKTLFNLGSISKTFVANAILILRNEGKLSLDDSLIKYFPEFKNKEIANKVKIRHLLTHTSGLPDIRPVSRDSVFYLTANDADNWHPITQTDSLSFEPGSRYEYSNPAFNGLALIIEKVSGQKWQAFVAERIFKPAGMTASTITDGPHPSSGVSHAYQRVHGQWGEDDFGEEPTFCAAGNGGVWSSVEELLKYQQAMEAHLFLDEKTLNESKEVKTFSQWNSDTKPFIGWSWFIEQQANDIVTVGHTGTQGGFYCDYVTIPSRNIFYVMLANFPCDREKLRSEVLRILDEEGKL